MHLAFFTDTYLPNVDGIVTSIVDTRCKLQQRGHAVTVYTAGSKADEAANSDPSVHFFRSVAFPPYPQYKVALFPFLKAASLAQREKTELVHCHAMATMGLAARLTASRLKVPLVGTFHTLLPSPAVTGYVTKSRLGKRIAGSVLWRGIMHFYKPFHVVLAPSRAVAHLLEAHGVHNVVVLQSGVDTRFFKPKDPRVIRQLLGIKPEEKIVLVAGRLSYEKNIDVVIRAAKTVLKSQPARFVVTGDGPAKSSLLKAAKEAGVAGAFSFEGFVNKHALPFYYSAADVVVSASTFETQGLSLLEAQACGTPCVGADYLAIPETVHAGKDGYLFEAMDAKDCAEKILKVLSASPDQTRALGKSARKSAERLSADRVADRLVGVYEGLLG